MSDELRLHHTVTGEGPPVVLTHGWLNTGAVWDGVVEALGGTARTVTWDLRGHGSSDAAAPDAYERADALADLDRMVDVAGRGSPVVVGGHSLGGYLSLAYAILHPERVAGLVLVAAGPGFRSPTSREQWNASVAAMAADADIPEGQEQLTMHVDSVVIDRLAEITVPVVTVCGERDTRFLASMDVFDKHLPVRERIIVADAGHMVHAKRPVEVADAVRRLLAELG